MALLEVKQLTKNFGGLIDRDHSTAPPYQEG